ncbi:hypothetical protein F4818DRAFT_426282 [Hypoxylon cercidicola]|nr:hypothetical protein F4818DRAFT_426282 [Hypoxylon cercidicola]
MSAMSFTSLNNRPSEGESSSEQEVIYIPPRRRRYFNIRRVLTLGAFSILMPGWFVALDLYRHPEVIDIAGLSSPHPFPAQIFERVKKVFEPDERYIGPSNQTHHNWDHLVAGELSAAFK